MAATTETVSEAIGIAEYSRIWSEYEGNKEGFYAKSSFV